MKQGLSNWFHKESTKRIISSLISIIIGLFLGVLVILITGLTNGSITVGDTIDGIRLLFRGIFNTGRDALGNLKWGFNSTNIGNMLFEAAPLIMTGLSVAVAYKTGLFNIGAPGQYLMGTLVCLVVALSIPSEKVPSGLIWIIAFVTAMVAGALWGMIPGLLKVYFNVNEVISCIMTNWIAAIYVTYFFDGSKYRNTIEADKSAYIYKTSVNNVETPTFGLDKIFPNSKIDAGIIIAIVIAIVFYIILYKTTLGYQFKACGLNNNAAKYAGIRDKRNIIVSMGISGALAAAGAAIYYLAGNTEFFWSTYQSLPAVGFDGIPVALLAGANPIGSIFAALFMSLLDITGLQISNLTAFNEYITDIIIAIIVYTSSFALIIKIWLDKRSKKNNKMDIKEENK